MSTGRTLASISLLFLCCIAVAQQTPNPAGKTVAERLGYPANSRLLVIHADDFGVAHSENRATIEALENGWVTSASIMVPCPWFPEVVSWAKQHPDADLGVHVTLNAEWAQYRWRGVSPQPKDSSLFDEEGYLPRTTQYVVEHAKASDVETEARAQIDKALAAGIKLSHIDTHMGTIASSPEMFKVYLGLGKTYKLPVLLEKGPATQEGDNVKFYDASVHRNAVPIDAILGVGPGTNPAEWLDAYKKVLAPLPPGAYLLIVHLAHDDAEMQGIAAGQKDWGSLWRQSDLDLVRNPEFQKFLKDQGFILVKWKDLARTMPTL